MTTRILLLSMHSNFTLCLLALAICISMAESQAFAADKSWNADIDNYWDYTTSNWTATTFTAGDNAYFSGTGQGNVSLGGATMDPNAVFVSNGNYQFSNGSIDAAGQLKVESGELTLYLTSVDFDGGIRIEGGSLALTQSDTLVDWEAVNVAGGVFNIGDNNERVSKVFLETGSQGSINSVITGGTGTLFSTNGFNVEDGEISANLGDVSNSTLLKNTAGTVTLSADNEYAGNTTISHGTLRYTVTDAMAPLSPVAVEDGATIGINVGGVGEWTTGLSGNGTLGGLLAGTGGQGNDVNYSGSVTLELNTENAASTQSYSGNIADVGSSLGITKIGAGTLTLSGNNSYTGDTTVNAGTLEIAGDGRLGVDGIEADYTNFIHIANNATFNFNSGEFQILSGEIRGQGDLEKHNISTLKLLGTNTYTGATTVHGGTLSLGKGGWIGHSATTVKTDATLTGDGTTGTLVIESGAFHKPGTSPGITNTGDYTLNGALEIEVNDSFTGGSPIAGTDFDQVNVTGTVTLGSNATLSALEFGTSNTFAPNLGAVFSIINNDGADTVSGTFSNASSDGDVIFGVGGLASAIDGTHTLKIYYNADGGGDGNFNDVVLVSATGTATDLYVDADFSGDLLDGNKEAVGTQQAFFGIDAYTTTDAAFAGMSEVFNGTLTLNADTTAYATVDLDTHANAGKVQVNLVGDTDEVVADVTITSLTGSAGDGIVLRSEGGTSGNLTVGGGTFSGVISETGAGGTLTKNTAGTLTLSGVNTYTGATTVNGGILDLAGSESILGGSIENSDIFVNEGATLTGSGTTGSLTIEDGGFHKPGQSPGITEVNGDYTLAGDLEIEVILPATPGEYVIGTEVDHVDVSGTATLNGDSGTITVGNLEGHTFACGDVVENIVNAAGGFQNLVDESFITGVQLIEGFDYSDIEMPTQTDPDDAVRGRVYVDEGGTRLNLVAAPASYTQAATTPNEISLAQALDQWITDEEDDADVRYVTLALDLLDKDDYAQAFAAISPSYYGVLPRIGVEQSLLNTRSLSRRMSQLRAGATGVSVSGLSSSANVAPAPSPENAYGKSVVVSGKEPAVFADEPSGKPESGFIQLNGQFAELESLHGLADNDFNSAGVLAGIDYRLNEQAVIGLGIGYNRSMIDYDNGEDTDIDTGIVSGYGTYSLPYGINVEGTVGVAISNYDLSRPIEFGDHVDRTARNDQDGTQFFAAVEVSRDFRFGSVTVSPNVGFQYTNYEFDGGEETGAGALNLDVHDIEAESYRLSAGVEVAHDAVNIGGGILASPYLYGLWSHDFGDQDVDVDATLSNNGGDFTYTAGGFERDRAGAGAGVLLDVQDLFDVNIGYHADLGTGDYISHSVFLQFGMDF
jgi:autotransporter-associated beta strand protein